MDWRILAIVAGAAGLGFVGFLMRIILRESEGTEKMREISRAVRQGAMAFLRREFMTLGIFTAVLVVVLALLIEPKPWVGIAYLIGTVTSALTFIIGTFSMLISAFYIFRWFPFGLMVHEFSYMLLLVALLISPIFLLFPIKESSVKPKVPWYDACLFFLSLGIPLLFASKGYTLASKGWEFTSPVYARVLVAIEFFLILEVSPSLELNQLTQEGSRR